MALIRQPTSYNVSIYAAIKNHMKQLGSSSPARRQLGERGLGAEAEVRAETGVEKHPCE